MVPGVSLLAMTEGEERDRAAEMNATRGGFNAAMGLRFVRATRDEVIAGADHWEKPLATLRNRPRRRPRRNHRDSLLRRRGHRRGDVRTHCGRSRKLDHVPTRRTQRGPPRNGPSAHARAAHAGLGSDCGRRERPPPGKGARAVALPRARVGACRTEGRHRGARGLKASPPAENLSPAAPLSPGSSPPSPSPLPGTGRARRRTHRSLRGRAATRSIARSP